VRDGVCDDGMMVQKRSKKSGRGMMKDKLLQLKMKSEDRGVEVIKKRFNVFDAVNEKLTGFFDDHLTVYRSDHVLDLCFVTIKGGVRIVDQEILKLFVAIEQAKMELDVRVVRVAVIQVGAKKGSRRAKVNVLDFSDDIKELADFLTEQDEEEDEPTDVFDIEEGREMRVSCTQFERALKAVLGLSWCGHYRYLFLPFGVEGNKISLDDLEVLDSMKKRINHLKTKWIQPIALSFATAEESALLQNLRDQFNSASQRVISLNMTNTLEDLSDILLKTISSTLDSKLNNSSERVVECVGAKIASSSPSGLNTPPVKLRKIRVGSGAKTIQDPQTLSRVNKRGSLSEGDASGMLSPVSKEESSSRTFSSSLLRHKAIHHTIELNLSTQIDYTNPAITSSKRKTEISLTSKGLPNKYKNSGEELQYIEDFLLNLHHKKHGISTPKKLAKSVEGDRAIEILKSSLIARHIASKFNELLPLSQTPLQFLEAHLYRSGEDSDLLVEDYLRGVIKTFVDSDGFEINQRGNSADIAQAFTHFSYQYSRGQVVIGNLRGSENVLRLPQVYTYNGCGYGDGNTGLIAYIKFFSSHKCNQYCRRLKLKNPNQKASSNHSSEHSLFSEVSSQQKDSVAHCQLDMQKSVKLLCSCCNQVRDVNHLQLIWLKKHKLSFLCQSCEQPRKSQDRRICKTCSEPFEINKFYFNVNGKPYSTRCSICHELELFEHPKYSI